MKITVVGLGYVGLSNALILAKRNQVIALDLDQKRVDLVNAKQATVEDPDAARLFDEPGLDLRATTDPKDAFSAPKFVIIATPTSYDTETNQFDTSSLISVIKQVETYAPETTIIILSLIHI